MTLIAAPTLFDHLNPPAMPDRKPQKPDRLPEPPGGPSDATERALIAAMLGDGAGEVTVSDGTRRRGAAKAPRLKAIGEIRAGFSHTPVEKWNATHLNQYVEHLYEAEFGHRARFGKKHFFDAMAKLRVKLSERTGEPRSHALCKRYIDYYFQHHLKAVVSRAEFFIPSWMLDDDKIAAFAKHDRRFGPSAVAGPASDAPSAPTALPPPTAEEVTRQAKENFRAAVLRYGLVNVVRWGEVVRRAPRERAVAAVTKAAVEAVTADPKFWANIAISTEAHGPYTRDIWHDVEAVRNAVKAATGADVKPFRIELCDRRDDAELMR